MMFLAEFFVLSTLNIGIRFHSRVKGVFLSLAHFLSIKIMFAPLSNKTSVEMKDFFPFRDISIFRTISLSPLMLLAILDSLGILSLIFLWVWKEESSTRLKSWQCSRQAEDASWHGENIIKLSLTSSVLSTVNRSYLFSPVNQMPYSFSLLFLFPCLPRSSCHRNIPSLYHMTCLLLPLKDWHSWAFSSDYCCLPGYSSFLLAVVYIHFSYIEVSALLLVTTT